MTAKNELQQLGEDIRKYFDQYCTIIEPYRKELWRYCYKITGSPWDAEDLYQDTILKLFTSLSSISHRNQVIHPKSFLYGVATNHWIDTCRKRKFIGNEYVEGTVEATYEECDPIELHEAFDASLQTLPHGK
jgi:RNA polymerase sigma factor (sigma-70 family)